MAKMVKCPVCNKRFDREKIGCKKKGNRYYHLECFQKHKQKIIDKKKQNNKQLTQEQLDRKQLIDYIVKLYGKDNINQLIFKQIKDFREQENYSYLGMKTTLEYFHEILENPVVAEGIGIIPYVYDEAKSWHIRRVQSLKHYNDLKSKGMTSPVIHKHVKIASKPLECHKLPKININDL